ncbi:MAG: HNH endonuclease, partial [Methanosarcinales archaeon]|nr:HNH endonuclease [Candidatus Ethanoperedens thermophilum]
MLVFVINKNGTPLMPCKPAKARHLLKAGNATVVQQTPLTIRLLWDCEEETQDITLGIDAGYTHVGFSAVSENEELIAGELTLRSNIKTLLEKRSNYRRTRRSRLWHREPRFSNRGIPKGWLAPSIKHKLDSHIKLIEKIKKLLPITKIVIEVAPFDAQKMQNPEISGIDYQQGELQGYEVREYLLEKFNRKCAYCGKKDVPLEIEHIIPKSRGGSDRVSNLTIACHECNHALRAV